MGYLWSCVARAQLRAQTFYTSHWIACVTEMLFDYLIVSVEQKAEKLKLIELQQSFLKNENFSKCRNFKKFSNFFKIFFL